jgi:HEAT repeat protein
MTQDADKAVRVCAAHGLARIGDERGVEELVRCWESPALDPMTRLSVLAGIAEAGHRSSLAFFQRILRDSREPAALAVAIRAADRAGDRSLLPELERLAAAADDGGIKAAAGQTLRRLRGF